MYSLLIAILLLSCNRGVYVSINNKTSNYEKNTRIIFSKANMQSYSRYQFQIIAFKKSDIDSSFFSIGAGIDMVPISPGDYSIPPYSPNHAGSGISFYDNQRNQYQSGGDSVYSSTFFITSLTKKRVKGWFKGLIVDVKADTAKPSNTLSVEGRFNVSIKNAKYY